MNFRQYVIAMQKLAEEAGETVPDKPYCDDYAWLEAFRRDLTPSEAWAEEMAANYHTL